ncbi:hypothetical protein F2Q70_00019794 [Brassica cretica]|uniref:eRF1 domain-containing protein n=1 Tax=Brassica cretica TaxID=69181 RepID=A0A8S9GV97_BRACR|nr:hypothetical protein F2Q70_00019794 [Brassica cretica]
MRNVVFSTTRSPSSTSREENGRSGGRQNIKSEIWKIKKLIKGLESARGNGTSMVMNTELLPTSRVVSTGTIVKKRRKSLMDGNVTLFGSLKRFFTSLPLISLRSMDEEDNLGFVLLLLGRRRDTTMSADFKTELSQSELFDPPLQAKILNINTRKYVFGVEDTLKALEMGAIETLIVWENLDINRYELKKSTSWRSSGEALWERLIKATSMTHAELESQEGSQFCRGFGGIGGIGGILRYQLDMRTFDELSDGELYEDSD